MSVAGASLLCPVQPPPYALSGGMVLPQPGGIAMAVAGVPVPLARAALAGSYPTRPAPGAVFMVPTVPAMQQQLYGLASATAQRPQAPLVLQFPQQPRLLDGMAQQQAQQQQGVGISVVPQQASRTSSPAPQALPFSMTLPVPGITMGIPLNSAASSSAGAASAGGMPVPQASPMQQMLPMYPTLRPMPATTESGAAGAAVFVRPPHVVVPAPCQALVLPGTAQLQQGASQSAV